MRILEINNLNELTKFKSYFQNSNDNISFFQSYNFLISFLEFYKDKFVVYLLRDDDNYIVLPLSNLKYKNILSYGFIGSPFISEENDAIHNINKFYKFEKIMNFFFKKNNKNFFFHNIKKGYLNTYLEKNFYKVESNLSNKIDINFSNFFQKSNIFQSSKKIRKYNLRKFSKDTGLDVKNLKNEELSLKDIKKINIYKFILENKIIIKKC